MAKIEASSPSINSSIITLLPLLPNFLSIKIDSNALIASFSDSATVTPFPAAKPSAFITIGIFLFCIYLIAFS